MITLPLMLMGLIQDCWHQFKTYRKIEKDLKSTFFFVPFRNNPGKTKNGSASRIRAVKYEVSHLKPEISELQNEGFEIGVHGIDSWIDLDNAKKELSKIKALSSEKEIGVRMHWLFMESNSLALLDEAGYTYDSSVGYNEIVGFRAGTFQVYQPPNTKVLMEIPLHIMDTTLFYPNRMNLSFNEARSATQEIVNLANRYGGVISTNWHHRSIAPERMWGDFYLELISDYRSNGGKFLTVNGVVSWFKQRRNIHFEKAEFKESCIEIKLSGLDNEPVADSDGMMIRVYHPGFSEAPQSLADENEKFFKDYKFSNKRDIKIPL